MPTYTVTITVVSTPPVQVFGVGVSYEALLNSFGSYWYLIKRIFIQSDNIDQINTPISFQKYDVTGMKRVIIDYPCLDPYQKQAAYLTELEQYDLVADSRLIVEMDILPMTKTIYTFYACMGNVSQPLNNFGRPNKCLVNV